jgi:Reverse transcriptase (RNA-dependent DNA polymerase)
MCFRLTNFISNKSLLNSSRSAFTKYHSTGTTLLAVRDYIMRAISQQQIISLCLLDLFAAFDTDVDHSTLIERLSSWYGIEGTALNWIKSYLSSRSLHVKMKNYQSSVYDACSSGFCSWSAFIHSVY